MLRRLVLLMLLLPLLASAAVLKEESLQRLLDQGRHEELEREARQTGGDQGLAAQLLARLARAGAGEFDALIELGEQCVQQFAQSAACHYVLGSALGMEAQSCLSCLINIRRPFLEKDVVLRLHRRHDLCFRSHGRRLGFGYRWRRRLAERYHGFWCVCTPGK